MNTGGAMLDQAALNRCTRAASSAVDAALEMVAVLLEAEGERRAPDLELLRTLADEANDRAQQAYQLLYAAGGREPEEHSAASITETPLHLLSTHSTRALLAALRYALARAELVDAERGNVLPEDAELLPGESRGTGWAETISNLAERLRVEVEGPRGSGRE
jgi:hypothetical protein